MKQHIRLLENSIEIQAREEENLDIDVKHSEEEREEERSFKYTSRESRPHVSVNT